ncbi:DUF3429 domain-containing protein [Sphingomonas japonica]|uniref:DUF3429 domain-containing protein n=1 Tax=Sphingomonas japonica TaxID=511662 RepID=A0ABX0U471_9SPHN|nr:DUF3429 domain-containing protein [Sphingomonas japonica]NIJ23582.1 hypothetical protein [Sphingomonas japonica]
MTRSIPSPARLLGFAGLLPQVAAVVVQAIGEPGTLFTAQAFAFAYAALIFSFLGGMWWGIAAMADRAPGWLWIAAVAPSLIALAACAPWMTGGTWPGPSSALLGIAIVATLWVDRRLAADRLVPPWWIKLRVPLSLGLGGLTLVSGLLA